MTENFWAKLLDRWVGIPLCFLAGLIVRLWRRRVRQSPPVGGIVVRRILLIKLAALGDTILLARYLRALRAAYPSSRIDLLASRINRPVASLVPWVDEVHMLNVNQWLQHPLLFWKTVKWIWARQYDMVVDYEQWMRLTPLLALASGARLRFGYATRNQHRHFPFTAAYRPRRFAHETVNFAKLTAMAGGDLTQAADGQWLRRVLNAPDACQASSVKWQVPRTSPDPSSIRSEVPRSCDLSPVRRPTVVIHPGCGVGGEPREWLPENYSRVADALIRELGADIVLTGGDTEGESVSRVVGATKEGPVRCLVGSSFLSFAQTVMGSDLVVCGNTGTMHLAAALGIPTVALHGPTDPRRWGPLGEGHLVLRSSRRCVPCLDLGFEYGCSHHQCMADITVEEVLAAAREVLRREPST